MVTGFHDDTSKQEVQHMLKEILTTLGWSMAQIQIKCPTKPITHAFLQCEDDDEKDNFVRSASSRVWNLQAVCMPIDQIQIKCPAKPITQAFLQFKDNDERDKFVRSATILKKELRGRKMKISPATDAEERFHQKRLGYLKCFIHTNHTVPLGQIKHEQISKTRAGRRTNSDQNMCKWSSQV